MNPTLMDYILNVLAPKEYRLEFKNRLENLCSLSGTPMSPGLSKWLTKTFGLEMTRVVQDYSSFSSPKFSPELQERINKIVPSNYQGYDANQGLNQLFDVSCGTPVPECYYYNFTELGNYQYTDLYLDSTQTTLAFNDIYGNGNLRNQLNALGGDLYWFFNGGFVLQGLWSHYYGTAPMSIDLYDVNGDLLFTLSFNENSLNGFSCDSKNNYTMTFDKSYDRFYGLAFEGINNFDYVYPTSTPYTTDYTDLVLMQNLINWIFGNNATYDLIDNGATYTMEIKNAIYWGAYPRWNLYNGVTIDAITMTPF